MRDLGQEVCDIEGGLAVHGPLVPRHDVDLGAPARRRRGAASPHLLELREALEADLVPQERLGEDVQAPRREARVHERALPRAEAALVPGGLGDVLEDGDENVVVELVGHGEGESDLELVERLQEEDESQNVCVRGRDERRRTERRLADGLREMTKMEQSKEAEAQGELGNLARRRRGGRGEETDRRAREPRCSPESPREARVQVSPFVAHRAASLCRNGARVARRGAGSKRRRGRPLEESEDGTTEPGRTVRLKRLLLGSPSVPGRHQTPRGERARELPASGMRRGRVDPAPDPRPDRGQLATATSTATDSAQRRTRCAHPPCVPVFPFLAHLRLASSPTRRPPRHTLSASKSTSECASTSTSSTAHGSSGASGGLWLAAGASPSPPRSTSAAASRARTAATPSSVPQQRTYKEPSSAR